MAKNMARVENGVVVNIEWCTDTTEETEALKDINSLAVEIGDTYDGSYFYRNGEKVIDLTQEAIIEAEDMRNALSILEVELNE